MDFTQNKLTKAEWETIEVPTSEQEKKILTMIMNGYNNVNIRSNETLSMFSYMKMEKTPEIEYFLYKKYFETEIQETLKKYGEDVKVDFATIMSSGGELKSMKSADSIRIQNLDNTIKLNREKIFEYLLIDLFKNLIKNIAKKKQNYAFYLYTLLQLKKASISNINLYVLNIIDKAIEYANGFTKTSEIIANAYDFIEKNKYLLKHEDKTLFSHQKELFTVCRSNGPKLIMYSAPTGTGKTLSPIGLSEKYRVIFVCVARHIGLALAKAAISIEKKVAFAFGCETASDVRLHYFSAINYTKNYKSGGIWKVDNSVGDNVEIMICDVQSYVTAMHYMLAFNDAENIITYWDEPTITLDYEEHPLHQTIHRNWQENKIPTIVLSCATLPHSDEIQPVFDDFRAKFEGAEFHTITSFDCKKSIPILNKDGYCVMPHYLYADYREMTKCVEYCKQNKTLLRYFDLREIIRFVEIVNDKELMDESYSIDTYFAGKITDITMNSLKEYYLDLLLHMDDADDWTTIYKYMNKTKKRKHEMADSPTIKKAKSMESEKPSTSGAQLSRTTSVCIPQEKKPVISTGISLTTADAYTLTDGPTIFLAEDVSKIGNFYIQQSDIAPSVFQNILSKIVRNGDIIKDIEKLESMIELKESKSEDAESKESKESSRISNESQVWMDQINKLRKEIKLVSLDPVYVPNTKPHQERWAPNGELFENAYVSNIGEDVARTVMMLNIENHLKVLLLLGIGMFTDIKNVKYMEIMKKLADEQRLFMIIASTDYIYGTNYQFCHGFIGKDLTRMTQQKTLQAMGRIGRNNIQQDYTIRFRDDEMITKLFQKQEVNLEAINMCSLFCSE